MSVFTDLVQRKELFSEWTLYDRMNHTRNADTPQKTRNNSMAKRKQNLNSLYISPRLRDSLTPIGRCALTSVVAPMGYGKTTAINWYLTEQAKEDRTVQTIRISIYSDNVAVFWKSIQKAFAFAGLLFLEHYPCPDDIASIGLLVDDLCLTLTGAVHYYIFIDDFHLMTNRRVVDALCILANRLPKNVHVIVASRDRFLPCGAVVRLGGKLHQITVEHLRLNHRELAAYAHRCGAPLGEAEIAALFHSSEGWFSAVYLNLCFLAEQGTLPDQRSDIYEMFSNALIDPLSPQRKEFLVVMGLADEFTAEMAQFITEEQETDQILAASTAQNAFVTRLSDGVTFRFHHMMKACAERVFSQLAPQKQRAYRNRYGDWYQAHRQYLYALDAYQACGNYDAALQVIQADAGILLAAVKPETVLAFLQQCPEAVLQEHPLTLLVLMRRMFTWKQIPKMMELKGLLEDAIHTHPEWPEEERANLLGERDLILSFLMYNDITEMSRLHRSASVQMSRPAVSIRNEGSWTFGSPSVLMMFHRAPGALDKELAEMNDCMPHYYKLTQGHGEGAELVMSGEAAFLQGRFADASIFLERAYARIAQNGQENIALCCDFLKLRLSLCVDTQERYPFAQKQKALMQSHNTMWLHIFESICACYHALVGQPEQAPALFREHRLDTVNFLAPCRPMMGLIENQVYLAQGAYAKVIGRSEGLLQLCRRIHYALVALHIRIQTAAAYAMLDKASEAKPLLEQALQAAAADGFFLPFVENYRYLRELLSTLPPTEQVKQIVALGEMYETRCAQIREQESCPAALGQLTQREMEITQLMGQHLTNKEVAQRLFLSEGTVKQYMNQIYAKLQITGDTRTKRKRLLELVVKKT